jgi:ABC-type spermidine/putrescine transport system permease subunit I
VKLRESQRRALTPWALLTTPVGLVIGLFVAPLTILLLISLEVGPATQTTYSISNYTDILGDSTYRQVALDTFMIASIAMVVQLAVALPFAYLMAFKAGRWELAMLLGIVLADQLNPMIRIYAWRMLLGREGVINSALTSLGVIDVPIDALLFSKFATITVLATSSVTYTIIPIYAAMKAIDANMLEAARDLGAGWVTQFRRVLIPLAAPGIFASVILVYIPLFTVFTVPELVGGPDSFMLGSATQSLILQTGDFQEGAALSFLMLIFCGLVAALSYRLARMYQPAR